jgi:transposase/DNA-binding CsgD family transcriptional regulator
LLLFQLLRAPVGSRLVRTDFDGVTLTLGIATTTPYASCPVCGHETWRVHSHYTRCLAEEPVFGRRVRLRMTVRRFLCPNSGCPRRIFVEPLHDFAARYARTTTRLDQTHRAIGSALGGEAGARLSAKTAVPTSPDTLLRRVKQAGARSSGTPRFVGIDDWAWCKGQRHGTIVVDLEKSDIVDLLPDRDAPTVRTWLEAHPGVELVSRDRWSAYAQAATEAAPEAQQVADRWHLLKNVREAVERLLERHLPLITDALKPADTDPAKMADASLRDEPDAAATGEPTPQESPSAPTPVSPRQEAALAKRQRRAERFEQVHELRRQGTPIREIARTLAMSRRVVRGYLRRERCPDWRPGRTTRSGMDPHREWIDGRIAEGRINASELHRELASGGVRLSYATVRRFLTKRLGRAGKVRPRVNAAKPKPIPPPSPKQLSFDWIRRPEKRTTEAQARLDTIRRVRPDLTSALDLADEFTALIRKSSTGTLQDWLSRAEVSPCPEVRNFAEGIRRDESAVNAAVTTRWSNGPVEGHVNRLKTIKRQMYGRAGFTLLKARVVNAA